MGFLFQRTNYVFFPNIYYQLDRFFYRFVRHRNLSIILTYNDDLILFDVENAQVINNTIRGILIIDHSTNITVKDNSITSEHIPIAIMRSSQIQLSNKLRMFLIFPVPNSIARLNIVAFSLIIFGVPIFLLVVLTRKLKHRQQ